MLEIILIILLGNLAAGLNWWWQIPINSGGASVALAVLIYLYLLYVGYTKSRHLRPAKLSGQKPSAKKWLLNLGVALGAGLLLTLPPLLFFLFPLIVPDLNYNPIKNISLTELLYRTLLSIPLFTAFSEEWLFRGYLYAKFEKLAWVKAFGLNAFIFTLWHLVVVLRTVLDTSLATNNGLLMLSYVGSLASVFVGGLVFLAVRHFTGSFWCAGLTHWLNVALMNLIIWLTTH